MIKAVLSGGLVVLVNVIAKRDAGIAGLIVAFPVITLVSAFWLAVDGVSESTMSAFFAGVLWGLVPTFVFVLGIVASLRGGLPLAAAVAVGALAWGVLTLLIQSSGWVLR